MKYNEWVTQLNANLLSVSEAERRKVLDYYAEAYADRRAAGFSENEIIDGFGAPYDAAQAILDGEIFTESTTENSTYPDNFNQDTSSPPPAPYVQPVEPAKTKKDYTWAYVLLGVVLAIPIFVVVVTFASLTISFAVAPFAIIASACAYIVYGFVTAVFAEVGLGIAHIGIGLITLGIGIALMKVFFMLVKLMWKLVAMFFKWLSGLFKGGSK